MSYFATVGILETMSAVGMLLASVSMSLLPDKKRNNTLLSNRIRIPYGNYRIPLVILNIVVMTYLQSSIETNYLGRVMSTLFTPKYVYHADRYHCISLIYFKRT